MVFKPDSPIGKKDEDKLNRSSFSEQLANSILSYGFQDSLVLGLYGKWGTGKTSIINMTVEEINKRSMDLTEEEKPIVMKFNPWNYSGQQQIISQFFNELSNTIKRSNISDTLAQVGEKLDLVSKIFSPLTLIPVVGPYAELIQKAASTGSEAALSFAEERDNDLISIKNELNNLLLSKANKIVIIIDDIDRLNSEEIRQIFQLVKTVGDLSNTVYILSFDKDIVVRALEKVQEGTGEDYLEKIIQLPFEIPTLSSTDVENILFSRLNDLIRDLPEDNFDQEHWAGIYLNGIQPFIKNLRDVNRLCNSLSFGFNLLKDEVNIVDYISITVLRIFAPDTYNLIKMNKSLFAGATERNYDYRDSEFLKKQYQDLIIKAKEMLTIDLDKFLSLLFPKVQSYVSNTHYGNDWLKGWRREKRICSPDYFDLYFQLKLPENEIPNTIMKEIIGSIGDEARFESFLGQMVSQKKISRFFDRLLDYQEEIKQEDIENVISIIFRFADKVPNGGQGLFVISSDSRINRIVYQLLKQVPSQDKRYEILYNALNRIESNLYQQVRLVGLIGQDQGKYSEKDRDHPPEDFLISSEQLTSLENLMVDKIIQCAKDEQLLNTHGLVHILFSWQRWGNGSKEDISKWVKKSTETAECLIQFVSQFLSEVRSQTGYSINKSWEINIEYLKKFIDIENVKERFEVIQRELNMYMLTEKQRDAIYVFLNTSKRNNGN